MNCDYDSFPYRDNDKEDDSEEEEEEHRDPWEVRDNINYQEILGLRDSYTSSLDIKYKTKEARSLEEKIKKSKKDLRAKIKRELADLAVIAGSISIGIVLSYESTLKLNDSNKIISYGSALIFPIGFGLIAYGFYRSFKRLLKR